MKARFQIAECCLTSAKVRILFEKRGMMDGKKEKIPTNDDGEAKDIVLSLPHHFAWILYVGLE